MKATHAPGSKKLNILTHRKSSVQL